jgi:hypothetical protein
VLSAAHSADRPVAAFLQNLVDGEAEAALALVDGAEESPLLSDEAYGAAENRISGFALGEPTVDGDRATVVATVTQGDEEYSTTFALESAGKAMLFWEDWRLAAVPLASVSVDFDAPSDLSLELGGAPFDRELAESGALAALPGDYLFSSPDDNANYTADSATASVVGFGGRAGVDPIDPVDVAFPVTLTGAGETAALAAMNGVLDACVSQTVLDPAGCGLRFEPTPGVDYINIRWTVTTRPTAVFGEWDGGGFPVVPGTDGRVDFAADITQPSSGLTGTSAATKDDYRFEGTVAFVDGAAAYESLYSVISRLQESIEGSAA